MHATRISVSRVTDVDDENELAKREHEYVARVLGITTAALDRHPYRMNEDDGSAMTWRVVWTDGAPDQVEVHKELGVVWTDIPSLFNTGGVDAEGS